MSINLNIKFTDKVQMLLNNKELLRNNLIPLVSLIMLLAFDFKNLIVLIGITGAFYAIKRVNKNEDIQIDQIKVSKKENKEKSFFFDFDRIQIEIKESLEDIKKKEKREPKTPFIKRKCLTTIRREEEVSELSSPGPELNLFTIQQQKENLIEIN